MKHERDLSKTETRDTIDNGKKPRKREGKQNKRMMVLAVTFSASARTRPAGSVTSTHPPRPYTPSRLRANQPSRNPTMLGEEEEEGEKDMQKEKRKGGKTRGSRIEAQK